MIGPGGRIFTTHHQDILDLLVDSGLRASPDVVEQVEKAHVEFGLYRELTKEEVESSFRRALTELEEASQCFVMKNLDWLHVGWSDRKS